MRRKPGEACDWVWCSFPILLHCKSTANDLEDLGRKSVRSEIFNSRVDSCRYQADTRPWPDFSERLTIRDNTSSNLSHATSCISTSRHEKVDIEEVLDVKTRARSCITDRLPKAGDHCSSLDVHSFGNHHQISHFPHQFYKSLTVLVAIASIHTPMYTIYSRSRRATTCPP